jgi:hypothetical protein
VPPVSEGSHSRSSGKKGVTDPGKADRGQAHRNRKPEEQAETKKQDPAYFLEIQGHEDDAPGRAPLPPAEDASPPQHYEDLNQAIAAAKARWAEVNREALEAGTLPGEDDPDADPTATRDMMQAPPSSSSLDGGSEKNGIDRTTPPGKPPADTSVNHDPMLPFVARYQTFAVALSNPQQARPIIDVFV